LKFWSKYLLSQQSDSKAKFKAFFSYCPTQKASRVGVYSYFTNILLPAIISPQKQGIFGNCHITQNFLVVSIKGVSFIAFPLCFPLALKHLFK
jgi:hypothetical protein